MYNTLLRPVDFVLLDVSSMNIDSTACMGLACLRSVKSPNNHALAFWELKQTNGHLVDRVPQTAQFTMARETKVLYDAAPSRGNFLPFLMLHFAWLFLQLCRRANSLHPCDTADRREMILASKA